MSPITPLVVSFVSYGNVIVNLMIPSVTVAAVLFAPGHPM